MSLHIYCRTDAAILLLGVVEPGKPIRFPSESVITPGLLISDIVSMVPINEQLRSRAEAWLGSKPLAEKIEVDQRFDAGVALTDGRAATLYLATLRFELLTPGLTFGLKTFPELLRAMPADKTRVAYLRAFQVLAGGLEGNVKAVDLDEMRRHLTDHDTKH